MAVEPILASSSAVVFVYGSLKRSCEHHDQMLGARFCGVERVVGYYLVLYHEAYPAMVRADVADDREFWVEGEVFEVEQAHLIALDRFEECPLLYQRHIVELARGRWAFAYLISGEQARPYPRVPGVWQSPRR